MKLEELEGDARDEVVSLLEDLVDVLSDECNYDHHGYCQAHFLQDKGACVAEVAKSMLHRLKGR